MDPNSSVEWPSLGRLEPAQPVAPLTSCIPGYRQFETAADQLAPGHNPLGFQLW